MSVSSKNEEVASQGDLGATKGKDKLHRFCLPLQERSAHVCLYIRLPGEILFDERYSAATQGGINDLVRMNADFPIFLYNSSLCKIISFVKTYNTQTMNVCPLGILPVHELPTLTSTDL